jgi:CheY-like chemotaxis protein
MILVVDDSDTTRALIVATVAPLGHAILEAANGREALALFEQHPVTLLITDDRMPEMSGADLIRAIRRTHPRLGIILVTAYDGPVRPLDWAGCNAILHKPFNTGALLALVESLVEPVRVPRRERRDTWELTPPG